MRLEGLEGSAVRLHDGSLRPIEDVARFMHDLSKAGYLFQEVLEPHPEIARITGGALATVRVVLLHGPGGTRIENITLKLPRAGAVADNFWRAGNMLGAVDAGSGAVDRVIIGSGLDLEVLHEHPDTGMPLQGLHLPDFAALTRLCSELAPVFPDLRLQGWDIALTDRGPVPVELNFGGDVNLQQLAHNAGAMTPAYCAHLRDCGYTQPLPG